MAYSVSALTNYTKDNLDELIHSSYFDAKTAGLIMSGGKVLTGIKSAENIQIIDNPIGFQADACGFNASGTTTFSQRTLTVGKVRVNQTFCEKDLEPKWTQLKLKKGSKYDSLTFAKDISDMYVGELNQALERAIWQGDTTVGSNTLSQFDGLLKIIGAATGVVDANTATYGASGAPISQATGITASNVLSVFQAVYKAIPANMLGKDDVRVFCDYAVYRTYQLALVTANYFNYAQSVGGLEEITIPGSNVKVIPVHGLDNATKTSIVAIRLSNMYMGVDLENEEERFEIYFDKSSDLMRFDARFKMGTQVGIVTEIVKFFLT